MSTANALRFHDWGPSAAGLLRPLVRLTSALAEAAGLAPEDAEALRWAALLHDAGLADAAIEAAAYAGSPLAAPVAPVREHPLGAALRAGRVANLAAVARILETHHEGPAGRGYPLGLEGTEIPFPAALLGLVETYLLLTAARPYRPRALSPVEALGYLRSRVGEDFHPAAVSALAQTVLGDAFEGGEEGPSRDVVVRAAARLRRMSEAPVLPPPVLVAGSVAGQPRGSGATRRVLGRLLFRGPFRHLQVRAPLGPGGHGREFTFDWCWSLFDSGRFLASSLDPRAVASRLAEAVHRLTSLPCVVHLVSDDGQALVPAAVSGLPDRAVAGLRQAVDEGLFGLALTQRHPVASLDATSDPRSVLRSTARALGVKSALSVPLWATDTPLGVIAVHSPTARRFPPLEVRALSSLAGLASRALRNAGLHRNVTDRLERLSEIRTRLEAVVDTVPAGILILSPAGHLLSANSRAAAYLADLGLTQPRQGDGDPSLLEGLARRLGATAPSRALASQTVAGPEVVSADLAPGQRHFEVWASPLRNAGGVVTGLLTVLHDVTESKRLASEVQRTEKLAAVGEVAARAAHEIKNPLASIRGFTQLLDLYCPVREGWPECSKYVKRLTTEIGRLTDIAHSMLTLARPVRPTLAAGALSALVTEVVENLAGEAARQGTTLEFPGASLSVMATFDARQLRQVLMNLIQNALEAVSGVGAPPFGWRTVIISIGYTRRPGRRYAFVRVRDNGPGIRGEDQVRIFTPFFTTKETGTGLGLPISKSIIEAHQGAIEFRPAPGRGCLFEVLLPAASLAGRSEPLALGAAYEVRPRRRPRVPPGEGR